MSVPTIASSIPTNTMIVPTKSYVEGQPWTYVGCPYDNSDGDSDYYNRYYDDDEPGRARNPHTDAIVISVAGACSSNGYPDAEAGYGVFFHRDNMFYNEAHTLPSDQRQTNQRAQLHACLRALKLAVHIQSRNVSGKRSRHEKVSPCTRLHHVVVKSHADYVVDGLTKWINKWEDNGYINAKGREVVNADLF